MAVPRALLSVVLAAASAAANSSYGHREGPAPRWGPRTLVVLGSSTLTLSHSRFLNQLQHSLGLDVTLQRQNSRAEILAHGVPQYDNLVFLDVSDKLMTGLGLDVKALTQFVDDGGSLFVTASPNASSLLTRNLALEFGIELDATGTRVMDHFSFLEPSPSASSAVASRSSHFVVLLPAFTASPWVVGGGGGGRTSQSPGASSSVVIAYDGLGMSASKHNILIVRALTGRSTTYSAVPPGVSIKTVPQSAGEDTLCVAAVQARNNARAVFSGSTWMFSDEAFDTQPGGERVNGNEAFSLSLAAWATQRAGVLRARNVQHARTDGRRPEHQVTARARSDDIPFSAFPDAEVAPEAVSYRINDEVEYNVTIERLELRQPDATTTTTDAATAAIESGEISKSRPSLVWVPYRASDVQLEFVMMDPYVRINMTQFEDASGVFSARFRVPDIHGVFHFRLQYRRPGLTVLHSTDQVSIRPFKHDEFERFIVAAAPYYTSALRWVSHRLKYCE